MKICSFFFIWTARRTYSDNIDDILNYITYQKMIVFLASSLSTYKSNYNFNNNWIHDYIFPELKLKILILIKILVRV